MERFWTPGRAILVASAIAVLIPLVVLTVHETMGDATRRPATPETFDLDNLMVDRADLVPGLVGQYTTALGSPEALPIENVGFMLPDDRVLGVTVNEDDRAYPMGMLSRRQVVNDRLGGLPIAVFYCPLADSATVVERSIDNELLDFDVSGLLYQSDLLVYDRRHLGLWSQLGCTALSGPYAGRSLRHVNDWQLTTYAAWCATHPDSTVVSVEGSGGRSPYDDALRDGQVFPVSYRDGRLADDEPVVGVRYRGLTRAYPLAAANPNGLILDEIAGKPLVIRTGPDGSVAIADAPRDALVTRSLWFAWVAMYPETEVKD